VKTASSLYRALAPARRVALLTRLIGDRKELRALYIQRLVKRGGGFRAVTLMQWSAEKLAREIVRTNAQTSEDELDLLQALYVDVEPAVQETFLSAAGVAHEGATIDESLEPPFADAAAVARAADAVQGAHGDDGLHYLRTIARYNGAAWPGIESLVAALDTA
jgi:hypothetical protein